VAAGIVRDDAGNISFTDGTWDKCPRYRDAVTWIEQALTATGKVLVWANFRPALEWLFEALIDANIGACPLLIHGDIKGDSRSESVKLFKRNDSPNRVLVAHPRTMGTGQNFEVATSVLFFTRSYSYFQRIQAEDRAHRLSSKGTVTIGDMIAKDCPTDAKELETLRSKGNLADMIENFKAADLREILKC
jgi:SNF2 family DNA or RNA helicase